MRHMCVKTIVGLVIWRVKVWGRVLPANTNQRPDACRFALPSFYDKMPGGHGHFGGGLCILGRADTLLTGLFANRCKQVARVILRSMSMRHTSPQSSTSSSPTFGRRRCGFLLFVALALVSVLGMIWLHGTLPLLLGTTAQAASISWLQDTAPVPAEAALQGTATVFVSPASTTVNDGALFTIVVRCAAGTDQVNAAEVHLSFNPTYLSLENVIYGASLNSTDLSHFSASAGTVTYIAARVTNPPSSVTGTFDLFTLQFRAKQPAASTPLTLTKAEVALAGNSLSVTSQSGTVTILGPTNTPTPSITPTPSNTPPTTPVPTPTHTPTRVGNVQELVLQQGLDGYQGFEDTFINDWDREQNYHADWNVHLRSQNVKRILLKADVNVLPPGTIVEEAIITLFLAHESQALMYAQVYEMLTEWNDREATWLVRRAGVPWGMMGANAIGIDRGSTVIDERHIFPTIASYPNYPFDFDVTTLVQSWVNAPLSNYGLMIESDTVASTEYRFRSSEHSDVHLRPKLTIRFRGGEPITPTPTTTGPATATPTPSNTPIPGTPTATATPSQTPIYGRLTGRAFVDANHNRVLDSGERMVQGVVLTLRAVGGMSYNETRITDMDGRYLFLMPDSGQYELTVSSVPAPYRLIGPNIYGTYVVAGTVVEINFPLQKSAMLALPLILHP
jgi:hypothetical protein